MKSANASSLRTQQAVARFGKAARHPLCLAALDLWRLDTEVSRWSKELVLTEELGETVKQMKEDVQERIEQFRKERNEKEANQGSALLRKIDKQLLRVQKHYERVKKLCSFYQDLRREPAALFKREQYAALLRGEKGVVRALGRVRKRWSANEGGLKDGKARQLEILNMLRDKVIKAAWARGEAAAGFWEALRGGDRALSDEVWQERLTNREIHSHIAATREVRVAGDKDAKEIRRLVRKLKIRVAEDQRGRKRKPHLPLQKPKQQRGRPRTKPNVRFTGNLEAVEANKVAAATGKTAVRGG